MNLKTLVLLTFACYALAGNRLKRHLVFTKGSRLFLSLDVRDNLFDYSDFFAQVFGMKIEWDLPHSVVHDDDNNKQRIHRRDLYRGVKYFFDQQKVNGSSCLQKIVCEAVIQLPKSDIFLAQLYETIFAPSDEEAACNILKTEESCKEVLENKLLEDCPFSFASFAHATHADFHLMNKYK